jgi:L-ascorbate metabolism protein UlaG (beta-lactamase superfamily)
MEITYFGAGCIYIATKHTNILIDPDVEAMGLKLPKLKTDVVLYTMQDDERVMPKNTLAIDWPGEYEVGNIFIQGIAAQLHLDEASKPRRAVMYTINCNDKKVLVTGNIAPELSDKQFEAIGTVHTLVVPVGGQGYTLDGAAAAALVSRLEPQVVLPIHYDDGSTKYPSPQAKIDIFLGEVGSDTPETIDKLKISPKDDSYEESKIILLQRQN